MYIRPSAAADLHHEVACPLRYAALVGVPHFVPLRGASRWGRQAGMLRAAIPLGGKVK
jgi:hypothetical protein